jgi:hypothetical protein
MEPTTSGAAIEMPKYQCHKIVHALQIATIVKDGYGEDRETDGTAIMTPVDSRFAPIKLTAQFMQKHKPEEGGYLVVYEGGYQSFSPQKAFEDGYTLVK